MALRSNFVRQMLTLAGFRRVDITLYVNCMNVSRLPAITIQGEDGDGTDIQYDIT